MRSVPCDKNVTRLIEAEISATGGLLRLAPCWVPRVFLQPGRRLKLHPDDLYAFGVNRGGIDERWFASTTPAANEDRTPDEGLSYVVVGKSRFTLLQAVAECGRTLIGERCGPNTKSGRSLLRYFGPGVNPDAPEIGACKTNTPVLNPASHG
jgi:hypothetical protein